MNITADMVKELRERTGAGMMECKKALQEAQGDMEAAITALRKRGQAQAAKRAGRVAAEGVIITQTTADHRHAFMVEVNCETDFVARHDDFKQFAERVAQFGLEKNIQDVDTLLQTRDNEMTFEQIRQELITKICENIQVRRVVDMHSEACVGTYNHNNRIGVLVAINQNKLELAKNLAMHIAASKPVAIDADGVPPEIISKEREIYLAQAKSSGKSDDVIAKMVEGRLAKFIKEMCLVNQLFVKDPNTTIAQLLKENNAKVLAFERFEVGEGIEKQTHDFAQEVHAQIHRE